MTPGACSISGLKIKTSFTRDDVEWKVRICFVVVERPFGSASIQINIPLIEKDTAIRTG